MCAVCDAKLVPYLLKEVSLFIVQEFCLAASKHGKNRKGEKLQIERGGKAERARLRRFFITLREKNGDKDSKSATPFLQNLTRTISSTPVCGPYCIRTHKE